MNIGTFSSPPASLVTTASFLTLDVEASASMRGVGLLVDQPIL